MKTFLPSVCLLAVLPIAAFAQGSLTPPGAPSASMKSLSQVEARTPLPATPAFPIQINAAGSYYLTQNLAVTTGDAIVISADDVTLDLNGFVISSTAGTANGYAVRLTPGRSNIAISNGHIRSGSTASPGVFNVGPGFQGGVTYTSNPAPINVRVNQLSVSGVSAYGIDLGPSNTVVTACTVRVAGFSGIVASNVSDCSATLINGTASISATTVSNSVGSRVSGGGDGIVTTGPTLAATQAAAERAETRTPISSLPYTITASGSYFLTQNLSVTTGSGISVNASNVTIDLNGFTISSTANPNSGAGILGQVGQRGVVVRNGGIASGVTSSGGTFTGPGFFDGVNLVFVTAVLVEGVRVVGVKGTGINVGQANGVAVVRQCVTDETGDNGIAGDVVVDCAASRAGARGILAQVATNCHGLSLGTSAPTARGIDAEVANACYGEGTLGIYAESVVANSFGRGNGGASAAEGIIGNVVSNSDGIGNPGVYARAAAMNSQGRSFNAANGLQVPSGVGTNCFGSTSGAPGSGLNGLLFNGSRGVSGASVSQSITFKYDMP